MSTTNTPFEEAVDDAFEATLLAIRDFDASEKRHDDYTSYIDKMTEAKAALTQLHKAAIVAELEKAIRLILDTRHTVPVDTPYSDSYAPRLAKFVANAVCEARIDELEGIKFGFSTRPTNMDFVLGIEKRIAELRGERE